MSLFNKNILIFASIILCSSCHTMKKEKKSSHSKPLSPSYYQPILNDYVEKTNKVTHPFLMSVVSIVKNSMNKSDLEFVMDALLITHNFLYNYPKSSSAIMTILTQAANSKKYCKDSESLDCKTAMNQINKSLEEAGKTIAHDWHESTVYLQKFGGGLIDKGATPKKVCQDGISNLYVDITSNLKNLKLDFILYAKIKGKKMALEHLVGGYLGSLTIIYPHLHLEINWDDLHNYDESEYFENVSDILKEADNHFKSQDLIEKICTRD